MSYEVSLYHYIVKPFGRIKIEKNNYMKRTFLIIMAALLPIIGMAYDWVCIAFQGEQTHYVYSDIQKEGGNHLVWVRTTYNTEQERTAQTAASNQKKTVYEQRRLWAFDADWTHCALRQSSLHGAEGDTISTITAPQDIWVKVQEGSNGEMWGNAAKFILENQ